MTGTVIKLPKGAHIDKKGKLVVPKIYPNVSARLAAKNKKKFKGAKKT
jgi:hypothetical protein